MKSAKNILQPEHQTLNVAVLVLDESNTLSFAAAVDPMRAANRLAGRSCFAWQFVVPKGDRVTLTSGIDVPGLPLSRLPGCDLLIVVAAFKTAVQATPNLLAGLRRIAASGAMIAGVDTGPWLLAEAGLLDGHTATIHWEDLENLAGRFPAIKTVRDRFNVSGQRMTSSGAAPTIEMMLHLIAARHGQSFAARVGGLFLHDTVPAPDRPQSRTGLPAQHSAITAKANAMMESALQDPIPLADIAQRLGVTPRTLQQQFQLRLGTTPQDHYLTLRLAEARRLVTDTDMPLMDVAMATGFASQSSFARAFRDAFDQPARDLRRDFAGL